MGAKTFKRFLNASTSKEMHESQGSLSYKQTPKSSKISKFQNFKQFQTISNNFTKTIKNRLNFVGFCLGILDKNYQNLARNLFVPHKNHHPNLTRNLKPSTI